MMRHDDFLRRAIDAAFGGDFDRAFERGIHREFTKADVVHSVSGHPEENGRQRRARCGAWVEKTHGLGQFVTCGLCRCAELDEEADTALFVAMMNDAIDRSDTDDAEAEYARLVELPDLEDDAS